MGVSYQPTYTIRCSQLADKALELIQEPEGMSVNLLIN